MKTVARLVTTVAVIAWSVPASGQSVWYEPHDGYEISLEMYRPQFTNGISSGLETSLWFVSGQIPTSAYVHVMFELPMAVSAAGKGRSDPWYYWNVLKDQTAIGNPLFGVRYGSSRTSFDAELGVRLPVLERGKGDAVLVGRGGDFERAAAFSYKTVVAHVHSAYKIKGDHSPLECRLGGGLAAWFPTEGISRDAELLTDLFMQLWLQTPEYTFGPVLAGRIWITSGEGADDIAEASEFFLGFSATGHFNNVHPGFHLHVQLDNLGPTGAGEVVDYTIGVNLRVGFGAKTGG